MKHFENRADAGRQLAGLLDAYKNRSNVIVLGLPRGGAPVGYEIARALDAPLDVMLVRKLGVPGHEELAMGAIASGGIQVLNDDVVDALRIPDEMIGEVAARERRELERRERIFRGDRPPVDLEGRIIIVVDDGIATGATLLAAIRAVRSREPERIVAAVPVAPASACKALRAEVDEMICLIEPEQLYGVGFWYDDFSQTTDDEVRALLERSRTPSVVRG